MTPGLRNFEFLMILNQLRTTEYIFKKIFKEKIIANEIFNDDIIY